MRRTSSERLLIIKRRSSNEHDAIITALSPQRGRLNLVARGLFKPQAKLAGHLEPLTVVDALIVWGQRPLLSSASSRQSFGRLKNNLAAVVLASQIINRYQRWCSVGQPILASWTDLITLLSDWDNSSIIALPVLTSGAQVIQWRLASHLGYLPDLQHCAGCRRTITDGRWEIDQAGLFCQTCRPTGLGQQLSAEVINYWQMALTADWLQLTKNPPSPTILEQTSIFFNNWLNFLDYHVC